MEARELRIGNWVHFDNMMGLKHDFQVTPRMFRQLGMDLSDNLDLELNGYTQPIPLTEEWLVRFGWRYFNGKTDGTLTMDTPCKLDIDFVEGKMQVKSHYEGFYRDLNIQYVHQLQNLYFALTGQELELIK